MPGLLDLAETHEPLAGLLPEQLDLVRGIFERQLASELTPVNSLCLHVEQYHGKMLRPTLVLLSGLAAAGEACDASALTDEHRGIAAVVEMIHMATLVHDDVLDEAKMRRRGATVNHLWGNEAAVMLGDYLISNAFHLCSTLGDPSINLALGEVTNTLCEGELMQLHHRDDHTIDEATYVAIVQRKTASLIGACCRLGARHTRGPRGGPAVAEALRRFGVALGTAFQIQDDLLDLVGEQSVVGKSLGKDLDKGKLTLPVIKYLDGVEGQARAEALRLIRERDAKTLRQRLLASGAVNETRRSAGVFMRQAKDDLAHVPPGPARDMLETVAENVVSRTY